MQSTVDRVVRLRDGRSTGFAEFGAREGFPVVNAHGGLACRLDVASAAPVAGECGIRLISPDRPGVGLSDPKPGRTVLDWAPDVAELLDQIDVDRFAVMGWSMGGQYAAAVAHALQHRVTRVAIIAGALPLTDPGVYAELPVMDRFLTKMSRRAPWPAQQWFRLMRFSARVSPELYGRLAARTLGPADGAVIRDDGFEGFARMSLGRTATARHRRGVSGVGSAMGIRPGRAHRARRRMGRHRRRIVDASWPHRLARIPGATLNIRDGGHFMAHLHYREIFDSLRG